jgi:hypothetical protein
LHVRLVVIPVAGGISVREDVTVTVTEIDVDVTVCPDSYGHRL